ncbi:ABC transporter permease, partial [Rhizobium ruizarguesonis]
MTAYTERGRGSRVADFFGDHAHVLSFAIFFLACLIFFSIGSETFFTLGYILNIIRQAAPFLIVAIAMTFVIITG